MEGVEGIGDILQSSLAGSCVRWRERRGILAIKVASHYSCLDILLPASLLPSQSWTLFNWICHLHQQARGEFYEMNGGMTSSQPGDREEKGGGGSFMF